MRNRVPDTRYGCTVLYCLRALDESCGRVDTIYFPYMYFFLLDWKKVAATRAVATARACTCHPCAYHPVSPSSFAVDYYCDTVIVAVVLAAYYCTARSCLQNFDAVRPSEHMPCSAQCVSLAAGGVDVFCCHIIWRRVGMNKYFVSFSRIELQWKCYYPVQCHV